MKQIIMITLCFSTHIFAAGFSSDIQISNEWNSANHPKVFFNKYNKIFNYKKEKVMLSKNKMPWSDDYWPRSRGGIAYRWQTYLRPKRKDLLNKYKVKRLKKAQLKKLSPAEKFDILNGDYEFSLTKKILRTNPISSPSWQGICHGWAEASLKHKAQNPKTLVNPDGIEIEFGTSDINALLSYYYGKVKRGKVKFLGTRCRGLPGTYKCENLNAGAFHIVLVESMKRQQGFVVDIDPDKEVWNQPVVGYEFMSNQSRNPSPGSSSNTVKEVLINLKMTYLEEKDPEWGPKKPEISINEYTYWLELDQNNEIVGGSWTSMYNSIDFAWGRRGTKLPKKYQVLLQ